MAEFGSPPDRFRTRSFRAFNTFPSVIALLDGRCTEFSTPDVRIWTAMTANSRTRAKIPTTNPSATRRGPYRRPEERPTAKAHNNRTDRNNRAGVGEDDMKRLREVVAKAKAQTASKRDRKRVRS
jgi:hypothetical protein